MIRAIPQSVIIEFGVSISSITSVSPLLKINPRLAPAVTKMKVLGIMPKKVPNKYVFRLTPKKAGTIFMMKNGNIGTRRKKSI